MQQELIDVYVQYFVDGIDDLFKSGRNYFDIEKHDLQTIETSADTI